MNKRMLTLMVSLLSLLPAISMSDNAIKSEDTGLSKTSVFDTPTPKAFNYSDKFPGTSTVLPRSYAGAPPQIPHFVGNMKPITADKNVCVGCHDNPAMRGKTVKGMATPMPESHYTDQRHSPGKTSNQMIGARYVCTQCHVPQADAKVLVGNTFNQ